MIKNKGMVNASLGQGKVNFPTLLLEVYPEDNAIVVDGSSDDSINQLIGQSRAVSFNGSVRGVNVAFVSKVLKVGKFKGAPAFSIGIPSSIKYFQARSSFRVKTQSQASCTVSLPNMRTVTMLVDEVSVGGVHLMLDKDVGHIFATRQVFKNCQLNLGGAGKIECTLEVRNVRPAGGKWTGIGCSFVQLPATAEAALSRFIAQQEIKSRGRL
nr:flagellar brake protein [Methylogaea oryzae]